MEEQTPQREDVPMHREEIVKDDGRVLIYYTFPLEESTDKEAGREHV